MKGLIEGLHGASHRGCHGQEPAGGGAHECLLFASRSDGHTPPGPSGGSRAKGRMFGGTKKFVALGASEGDDTPTNSIDTVRGTGRYTRSHSPRVLRVEPHGPSTLVGVLVQEDSLRTIEVEMDMSDRGAGEADHPWDPTSSAHPPDHTTPAVQATATVITHPGCDTHARGLLALVDSSRR